MMQGMFPSPQHSRRPPGSGVVETPGRPRGDHAPLPFIPPAQSYDGLGESPSAHVQHPHSSRVEHRRHADGSMSISIGGDRSADGSSFGGETRLPGTEEQSMNISDVSHLLLYSDNGDGEAEGGERQESNTEEKGEN